MPIIEVTLSKFDFNNIEALIIGCTHFYHIKKFLNKYLEDKNCYIIEPAKIATLLMFKKITFQKTTFK